MSVTATPQEMYALNGFAIVRGLFGADETARLADHYMALRAEGAKPGDYPEPDPNSADPLCRYPRMIHMHRWDAASMEWMVDTRLNQWLTEFMGREPYAVQTMLYFKPPGARGQALHQDQAYLRVKPGTCMAAWMALDASDEENGCMLLVPRTEALPILCTQAADTSASFTDVTVPLAEGMEPVPALMNAGDVLFFNGSVIHGSLPNTSATRWRRALIGHYIAGEAEQVGGYYHPVYRMDGTHVELSDSGPSGPCGVWANDGRSGEVEMIVR